MRCTSARRPRSSRASTPGVACDVRPTSRGPAERTTPGETREADRARRRHTDTHTRAKMAHIEGGARSRGSDLGPRSLAPGPGAHGPVGGRRKLAGQLGLATGSNHRKLETADGCGDAPSADGARWTSVVVLSGFTLAFYSEPRRSTERSERSFPTH